MTTIIEKVAQAIDINNCNWANGYEGDIKLQCVKQAKAATHTVLDELIAEAEKEQKIAENGPLDTSDYELNWLKHWLKSYKDKL
jgi:hypothetical protein